MSFTIDDKAWREEIIKFARETMPKEMEKKLNEMANRLMGNIKENTPIGRIKGGTLRGNWFLSNVIKKRNSYFIEIVNETHYAPHVEYGHRQIPGKYVPALGKKLKKSKVPGRKMMKISVEEFRKNLPQELQAWLDELVKYMG